MRTRTTLLALLLALTMTACGGDDDSSSDASDDRSSSRDRAEGRDDDRDEREDEDRQDDEDEGGDGSSPEEALALGESATIGDYEVAITDVDIDADLGGQEAEGQFVVVDVEYTYEGDDEGDPSFDLYFVWEGPDGDEFADTDTRAEAPNDSSDSESLGPGESGETQFVLDVDEDAIEDGALSIEPTTADERTYWLTG